jgi:hypothetical protein
MSKTATIAASAAAVFVCFGGAAVLAGTDGQGTDFFARVDANNDGVITRIEAQGPFPTLTDHLFDKADENHDGVLEEVEWPLLEGLVGAIGGTNTPQPPPPPPPPSSEEPSSSVPPS